LVDKARQRAEGHGDNMALIVVKLEPLPAPARPRPALWPAT
jgi:hypothetical protein